MLLIGVLPVAGMPVANVQAFVLWFIRQFLQRPCSLTKAILAFKSKVLKPGHMKAKRQVASLQGHLESTEANFGILRDK